MTAALAVSSRTGEARRKASGVGLLALKDQIAEMHGAPVAVQLNQNIKQSPGVGTGSGPGVGAGTEAGLPVRALITSNAAGGGGGSGKASRSIEEIKLVFERNKGAIYAIYNRALREDPALQGKVVVELKIAPSGGVVDCRVVSSELHAFELESKLLARIRQFDFGAKDVDTMVVTWPVDFLPS